MNTNKKLVLNKQIMANLSDMKETRGGVSATIGTECAIFASLICTQGRYCDIPTIGHDDWNWCLSKEEGKWCYGI